MIVFALDPGQTTGAVAIHWDGTPGSAKPDDLIDYWQMDWDNPDFPLWLVECIDEADLIVYERFFISPRTLELTRQDGPLDVIGSVKLCCRLGHKPVRAQTASAAKDAYPNARLTELGWSAVKGRHAKDALRHVLLTTHTRLR